MQFIKNFILGFTQKDSLELPLGSEIHLDVSYDFLPEFLLGFLHQLICKSFNFFEKFLQKFLLEFPEILSGVPFRIGQSFFCNSSNKSISDSSKKVTRSSFPNCFRSSSPRFSTESSYWELCRCLLGNPSRVPAGVPPLPVVFFKNPPRVPCGNPSRFLEKFLYKFP